MNQHPCDKELYIVMAQDIIRGKAGKLTAYCVCDTRATAQAIIDKDTERGDIAEGAEIINHTLQTEQDI